MPAGSRDDLRVNDAGPGIDGIAADIGGGNRIRELRQIVGARQLSRYCPIMLQVPSADTLTRASGRGEATMPIAKRSPLRASKR